MPEISGIIAVDKPQGLTSFDVVARLRRILKIRRIGHAGTLDPMATGVLPVFVGKATKCCDILPDKRKRYRAGFRLGLTSDTQDISGEVISRSECAVSREEILQLLPQFVGDIMQTPPMYSAVKVGGKRLYEIAREGGSVERAPRRIHVAALELLEYDEGLREGVLDISCGQGTYVRTLIHDMGSRLGAGGVMTTLRRTLSNGFEESSCHSPEEIAAAAESGSLSSLILPTDQAFAAYGSITLNERLSKLYKNGVRLYPEQVGVKPSGDTYRVYGAGGEFFGIGHFAEGLFCSRKNFF